MFVDCLWIKGALLQFKIKIKEPLVTMLRGLIEKRPSNYLMPTPRKRRIWLKLRMEMMTVRRKRGKEYLPLISAIQMKTQKLPLNFIIQMILVSKKNLMFKISVNSSKNIQNSLKFLKTQKPSLLRNGFKKPKKKISGKYVLKF